MNDLSKPVAAIFGINPHTLAPLLASEHLKERKRQIEREGFSPSDDYTKYPKGELVEAALAYMAFVNGGCNLNAPPPTMWPWDISWWKPVDAPTALRKAGALFLAEQERLYYIQVLRDRKSVV